LTDLKHAIFNLKEKNPDYHLVIILEKGSENSKKKKFFFDNYQKKIF
jgi:hypothetical protein